MLSFFMTALVRGELKNAWSWSDEPEKPLESADVVMVDTKSDGNESATGNVDLAPVEEKVETEPDASEAENKPKKKRSKKKAT
jgi:minor histocompatibility antigen H13